DSGDGALHVGAGKPQVDVGDLAVGDLDVGLGDRDRVFGGVQPRGGAGGGGLRLVDLGLGEGSVLSKRLGALVLPVGLGGVGAGVGGLGLVLGERGFSLGAGRGELALLQQQ